MLKFIPPAQNYWDNSYAIRSFSFADENDPLVNWINDNLPNGTGESLEIGICPGRYAKTIADKGYIISGIDRSSLALEMKRFFDQSNIISNEIIVDDFLSYRFDRKFQVVSSLGFIEHFKSWKYVFRKQASLVLKGGYFICEVPNFSSPIQLALREELDMENLSRHNLDSMDLESWRDILHSLNFLEVWSGPFGRFDFWVDKQERTPNQISLLNSVQTVSELLKKSINKSDLAYSPYIGIIAKKM